MTTVQDILAFLAQKAPMEQKLSFDNVGLLVGRSDREVHHILTALDITEDVIQEAIDKAADLIVSHHPLFFELKFVTDGTWTGARALTLAENRIAAICMHTNLDAAQGGVNDALMNALGATVTGQLDETSLIGRVGQLPQAMPMEAFLPYVKKALAGNGLRYHDAGKPVQRLAVCGGSGGGEIALAYQAGCDTYVTADVKYDQFLEAKHLGINLIDADHFCTENVVVPVLKDWLTQAFPHIPVTISQVHKQTAQFY
jgi:dinuclear metal center YbgI/SA1388 family protein